MAGKVIVSGGNGITLHYKGMRIALDPLRETSCDVVFVSHAHIDHVPSSTGKSKVIASKETAFLAKERNFNLGSYEEELEGFQLLDSGHILGSRCLLIDGEILYTGDIAGRPRAFLRGGKSARCKTLIVESTYGKSEFSFPPVEEVVDRANHLISDLFSLGKPVVLMGYPLGKAQVLTYLFSSWDPIYLHSSVHRMNQAHAMLGVNIRQDMATYKEARERGLLKRGPWIMIAPLHSGRTSLVRRLKKDYGAVTVAFTGWSIDPSYRYMMSLDYAFPLSDHCDFKELVELVKYCKPEKVYTVHGFSREFSSYLRGIGFEAAPILGHQRPITDYVEG